MGAQNFDLCLINLCIYLQTTKHHQNLNNLKFTKSYYSYNKEKIN